jgi:lipoprotein-anchoring transpeptidase ErfK/SrfK
MVEARGLPAGEQKSIVLQPMATSTPTATEAPGPKGSSAAAPLAADIPLPTPTQTPEPAEPSSSTQLPALTPAAALVQFNPQLQPAPPGATSGKRVIVDLSEQHLYAYQGNELVHSFVVSTGADNATRTGTFSILDKIPKAWSDPWRFWMPDWLGLYWAGVTENGIHALPVLPNGNVIWGDGLGTPISHGCVVLSTQDARLLYDWVEVGTQVQILR